MLQNFAATSFDDNILEVVAVFGSVQLGISRVINLQRHRIAQVRDAAVMQPSWQAGRIMSVCLFVSVCLSVCLSVSVYLSVCLSVPYGLLIRKEKKNKKKKKISHRQLGPLRGSSSPFQHFEPARVKPN